MSAILDKVFDALDYEDLLTNADDNGRRKVIAIIKRVVAEEMPAMEIPRQRVSSLGYTDGYRKGRNEFRAELLGEK